MRAFSGSAVTFVFHGFAVEVEDTMNRIEEALDMLRNKPIKTTTFQRVELLVKLQHTYDGLPQPVRFGNVVYDFFNEIDTPVMAHDILVGRHVEKELTESEEAFFQSFLQDTRKNLYRTTLWGTSHCTIGWAELFRLGLPGMRELAEEGLRNTQDEDRIAFYKGIVRFYDGMLNFARRYELAARSAGLNEAGDVLAALCEHEPRTLREALQLSWLVNLVNCSYLTLNPTFTQGRLDMLLNPLYLEDVAAGRLTEEGAMELIQEFYCKHNLIMGRGEHQLGSLEQTTTFQRILNYDAPQYLPLAGTDREGRPVVNELTHLFVKAIVPGFKNPIPVIRYFKGMAQQFPELWDALMEKALKSSSMMFYNDDDVKRALLSAGVDEEDAWEYEHFGCNWCSPGPKGQWMCHAPRATSYCREMTEEERKIVSVPYMRTNLPNGWAADFLEVLHDLNSRLEAPTGIEAFYDAFFARFRDFLKRKLSSLELELTLRQRHRSGALTLAECFDEPSLRIGESKSASAKYHFELQTFCGIGTLVDCFSAVEQLVYRDKSVTLDELVKAVDANFEGYGRVLALCRNAEKFGSDTEMTNRHARRLTHESVSISNELARPYVEKYRLFLLPSLEGDNWHIKLGALCPATPDGRLAGEPFTQNSRPAPGACKQGVTAMLNSMLNLSFDHYASGALNLDVQPKDFQGDAGRALFGSLLSTYFDRGGLHAQVSCVDVNDLKDAQIHPDKHRDLLVRVTGYSGVFVDMSEQLQDYVITRMNP